MYCDSDCDSDCDSLVVLQVKPLGVIWGKYSQWSAKNTIMFDDIRRNFLMNPQSGLKVIESMDTEIVLRRCGRLYWVDVAGCIGEVVLGRCSRLY